MKLKNKRVNGTWYAPLNYIKSLKSVVYATHLEMTSSSGNWSGIFIQKHGDCYKVFSFSQEYAGSDDNFDRGYNLYVGDLLFKTKKEMTPSRIDAIERLACYAYRCDNF